MKIIIGEFLPRDAAHDRRGVKHGIARHLARRFIKAHRSLARLMGGKGHRLDLNDRTDVAGNAQPKNMPHFGAVGGLFRDVLIKAAHLRHLVNIGFLDRNRPRRAALTLQREGKSVGQDINRFTPLDRVLADEG